MWPFSRPGWQRHHGQSSWQGSHGEQIGRREGTAQPQRDARRGRCSADSLEWTPEERSLVGMASPLHLPPGQAPPFQPWGVWSPASPAPCCRRCLRNVLPAWCSQPPPP